MSVSVVICMALKSTSIYVEGVLVRRNNVVKDLTDKLWSVSPTAYPGCSFRQVMTQAHHTTEVHSCQI